MTTRHIYRRTDQLKYKKNFTYLSGCWLVHSDDNMLSAKDNVKCQKQNAMTLAEEKNHTYTYLNLNIFFSLSFQHYRNIYNKEYEILQEKNQNHNFIYPLYYIRIWCHENMCRIFVINTLSAGFVSIRKILNS